MIQVLSSYIKNIAIFIIFITLMDLALPDNKYKSYINLVSGFILLFIILTPVNNLLQNIKSNNPPNIFDLSLEMDKSIMQKEQTYYAEQQKEIVLATYKEQLNKQVENLVNSDKNFSFQSCNIIVSENEENFGNIIQLMIEVNEEEKAKPFIRIEKVNIKVTNENNDTGDVEDESNELKVLKKSIMDFYNLSNENIYITVLKKVR